MPYIKFTKGASTFTFSCGRVYPTYDPAQVNVPVNYSDGGQLYAYDKGIAEQYFYLSYERLNSTDHANFSSWLETVAVGPKYAFTMTDEDGVDHTVRLMDTRNPLRAVGHNKYTGTITLRKEII